MNLWDRYYNYYISNFTRLNQENNEELPFLRNKLFVSILILAFPISLATYIPSFAISLITNNLVIALGDSLALGALTFIYLARNINIEAKKIIFSIIFYTLSVMLFVYLGATGPSITILFCTSILITLFNDSKAGYYSLALNAILYLTFLSANPVQLEHLRLYGSLNFNAILGIGINLIAFNALAVLSVASLVERLNKSLLREKQLLDMLRKESHNLLIAKQLTEESDQLKSAFLANMSHEIRTPMNGILGFSSLLSSVDLSESDRNFYIELIQKSGERMLNVINEIIDISKIESGTVKLKLADENINDILDYVNNLLSRDAGKKGLALSYKCSLSQQGAVVETDSEKLYAILINLVKNAVKYTNAGSVEFGYELQTGSSPLPEKAPELLFFVRDTGIGIPKDRQKAVFERFIQADIADLQAREGAGLGLSIAKSYVEMLGGKIWVESEPGQGTTFYFTHPFRYEQEYNMAATRGQKNDIPESPKKLKILLAEDDETSALLLEKMIAKISCEIIRARTGREAVEACHNNPDIDLILMDIKMPKLNGYEATREIRQFNSNVIIIAQTAFGFSEDYIMAKEAGCNDYLSKPIDREKLLALIDLHVSSNL